MNPSLTNPELQENLREYYITPLYLQTMAQRCRYWSNHFIKIQLKLFHKTIPDYPEVHEILEGELHRRELNQIKLQARKMSLSELKEWHRTLIDPDHKEVVETEFRIKRGVKKLPDASE